MGVKIIHNKDKTTTFRVPVGPEHYDEVEGTLHVEATVPDSEIEETGLAEHKKAPKEVPVVEKAAVEKAVKAVPVVERAHPK